LPTLKLTATKVEKLPAPDPSGKQTIHWDSELRGFAVLCSGVSNSKTYVAQRDLPSGKARRVTVGAVNEISLDKARERAADILDSLRRGDDPKAKSAVGTLRQVLAQYLAARQLRALTVRTYNRAVENSLEPWLDLPLASITADMVEKRHRTIAQEIGDGGRHKGAVTANLAMRVLRALWTFAQERDPKLGANPCQRLRRQWNAEPRRKGHVRPEDMARFYNAISAMPNKVLADYLTLLLFTGMRKTEAASLTWRT
jgi:integrase